MTNNKWKLVWSVLATCCLLLVAGPTWAQEDEEEECGKTENKKVLKLLATAKDRKADPEKRYRALNDAIGLDEECAECYFELAMASYRRAKAGKISYETPIRHFNNLITLCPEYHSDPYYYLGVMHYARREYKESLAQFRTFLDFTEGGPEKFSKKWEKQVADVEEILPEVEFFGEFYDNPVPFNPVRVGGVCTPAKEYIPMLTPDNEQLFFSRVRRVKDKGAVMGRDVEELMASNRKGDGKTFDLGEALPSPFNDGANYGGVTFSVDNKEMFVTICKQGTHCGQTYYNCDIYYSHYTMVNGKMAWTEPEALGAEVNGECSWESQPSLSGDGKRLFFSKIGADTKSHDIYVSERDNAGNWSTAVPLDAVNTDGSDKTPFIHSDSQTLYFSSDGHFGAGGYDVFYTKFENGEWTRPKNIGIPINSEKDEVGFFVSTDGRLAYFSTDRRRDSQLWDIYAFELHKKARPEKVLLVKGDVKDENGEVIKDAKIELTYANTNEVREIPVDSVDGRYAMVVRMKKDEQVMMTIKSEGKVFSSKLIDPEILGVDTTETAKDNAALASLDDITLSDIKKGEPFRINDILYSTKKFDLDDNDRFILKQFAKWLEENPKVKIKIQGHTDNVGDPNDNLKLSDSRAKGVKELLVSYGVSASRVSAQGYGETKPVASNDSASGRAKNRRTEFVILSF